MYKGNVGSNIGVTLIVTMMAICVISPLAWDNSEAASAGTISIDGTSLNLTYDGKPLIVNAGQEQTVEFYLTSTYGTPKSVYIDGDCDNNGIALSLSDRSLIMNQNIPHLIKLKATADKFTAQGQYAIIVEFQVLDFADSSAVPEIGTYEIPIEIHSNLSSGEQYNKFMGIWSNDFDAPLNAAWFPALVTCLIWLGIGYAVRLVVVPIVMRLIIKRNDPDYDTMKKSLLRMCFVIIVLNGISKAFRVLGVSEAMVDSIQTLFYICYIVVGALVAWRLYMLVVNFAVKKISARDLLPGGSMSDFESLKPLFLYIGEIVLSIATVGSIMSLLGFNMTAIITSAGVISLGITMGAQSVLSQFFSGLVILSTRPFKVGDLITLNGGSITYRVKKVNVMFTEFENWDNTDISIVPNSTLTSGVIKNLTRETLKCKVHIFMDVAYGTDLAYARSVMLEVANSNARVIKDGSVSKPSTRVTEFGDSNIQIRLSVYVDDVNDSGVIGGELRQALYNKFNERGISIDYTHIVVMPADPDKE